MRYFFLLLILLLAASYIFLSYANIYNFIGKKKLTSPFIQEAYVLEKGKKSEEKLSKTIRYVAMGDSLTLGVGSSDYRQTYPYILGQRLLKDSDSVILINLARAGARSSDVIKNQLSKAISESPDVITILIGVNDIHGFRSKGEFKKNLEFLINELTQKTHAKLLLINIPYLGGSGLILPPFNFFVDYQTKQFNNILVDLSHERQLGLFDIYTPTKMQFSQKTKFYSADLFHPSSEGYILWGQFIDANWR